MSGRFEGADGIRGVACLIVICIHAIAIFFPSTRDLMAGAGKIGVWLFFVLSAFLLTSKFMRSGFERKTVGVMPPDGFEDYTYILSSRISLLLSRRNRYNNI